MTLFYHGTTKSNAIKISQKGEIVSPWQQKIELLHHISKDAPHIYQKISSDYGHSGPNGIEKIALEMAHVGFAPSEKDRVTCVCLYHELPKDYEVVLGIEMLRKPEDIIFIPRRMPLTPLKEVRYKNNGETLRAAFARYKPKFIQF